MLDDLNKNNCFKVPDGYFEHLPEDIQKKCYAKNKIYSGFLSVNFVHTLKYAIPALLILITLTTGIIYLRDKNIQKQEVFANNISIDDLNDIDENTILAIASNENVDSILNSNPIIDYDDNDVINYMTYNNVNIEEILTTDK
jgi:hypothetical protein